MVDVVIIGAGLGGVIAAYELRDELPADCRIIVPTGPTPVPVGVPKTGFMIESMVTAVTRNMRDLIAGREPHAQATWNAVCLADFGDTGVALVATTEAGPERRLE